MADEGKKVIPLPDKHMREMEEASILLEAGARVISDLEGKLKAKQAELDEYISYANLKYDARAEEIARVTRARDIACYNITELNDQKGQLTAALHDAMVLIDHLIGELQRNNIVPTVTLTIAKGQFDVKMRKLLAGQ